MGIRGAKPSIESALQTRQTYVPTGLPGALERPADLTPAAAHIWDVLLADLTEMGVFRPADSLILVEVCEMLQEAKRLRKAIDQPSPQWIYLEKDISPDERQELLAQPELLADLWPASGSYKRLRTAYLQTMRTLKSYIDEFGITPVARLRLGLLQLQGADLLGAFRDDDESDVEEAPKIVEAFIVEDD